MGDSKKGMNQDYIAVGYQAFWDSTGDKSVLEAVQKIADEINKRLAESVNIAKSFQVMERIVASFEEISKSSGKVAEAAKKNKAAIKGQEESVADLIKRYRELDEAMSKPRQSTPYHVGQEIKGRLEALSLLQRALKQDPGNKGLVAEYTKQNQMLQQNRAEMKRITGETSAINVGTKGVVQETKKFYSELKRVNAEIKRWGGAEFGDEGIRRQIELLKKRQEIFRKAADESAISEKRASEIIDGISAKIKALTDLRKKDTVVVKETSKEREVVFSKEEKELQKLASTYDRLKAKMGNLGGTGDDLRIRARLEKVLQRNIEDRIAAGSSSSAQLREELAVLNRDKVTVDQLAASWRRLKASLSEKINLATPLADIRSELLKIEDGIKRLDQIKKMGGATGAGVDVNREMERLLEQKQRLLALQKDERGEVTAEAEAEKKKTAELQKQSGVLEKQRAQMVQLVKVFADGEKMSGMPGASMAIDSLKKQKALLDQMRKSGTIGTEAYELGYQKIEAALVRLVKRQRELQKAEATQTQKTVSEAEKKEQAIRELEAEYERLGRTIMKLGNSSGSLIIQDKLLAKQMGILQKLIVDYDYRVEDLTRDLGRLAESHAKVGAAVQNTNHRWGRSFKDLLRWQMEWYTGTMLLLGATYQFGQAIHEAFDFTQDIRDAGAIVGATTSELDEMREAALNVGATVPITARQAAEALKILGQAGLDAKNSIYALDVVASMMVATGADVEDTVKAMTTAMEVWNFEGERVSELGNMMAAAMNYSKLEMKDLGVVFNYLASTAEQVGWSFQRASAAAAVLSNHGIRTSTIGTGLSSVISSLIAPTEKMVNVFNKFGISMDQIDPRANSLADIIEKMKEAGMGADSIFEAFNKREARLLVSALNAGADAFRTMEDRLTHTNALLKMTADSMKGAKNQIALLGNEIQNAFNRAVADSESTLAAMAKGVRWVTHGVMEAAGPITLFNAGLFLVSQASVKAAGGVNLLSKALKFIGGWWTVAAVGVSAAIAAYASYHKTSEEQIAQLKEEADAWLIQSETVRQRNVAMDEATKKATKNKDSQEELRRIRSDIIQQYPMLIEFLTREGEDINGLEVSYDNLINAMKRYKLAGVRELPETAEGYFSTVGKELEAAEKQMAEVREKYEQIRKPVAMTGPAPAPMAFDRTAEELREAARNEMVELNKLQAQREGFIRESAQQIENFLKAGMKPDEIEAILKATFSGPSLDLVIKNFAEIVKVREVEQKQLLAAHKLAEDVGKERIKNVGAEYDAMIETITDRYSMFAEKIEGSTMEEGKKRSVLVDLERERSLKTMQILEREADLKIQIINNTEGTWESRLQQTHEVETKLAKDRRKVYNEMYAYAKEQADKLMADVNKSYDWQQQSFEQRIKWQAEWFKIEEDLQGANADKTMRFYETQTDEALRQISKMAKGKLRALKEISLSEEDWAKQSEDIVEESAESQIAAYEELRDSIMSTYKELLARMKEIEKKSKDIKKSTADGIKSVDDVLKGIFGGGNESFSDVESGLDDLKQQIKKALSSGTEEGLDEAEDLLKQAGDLMGNIDYEEEAKKPFKSLLDSSIQSMGDDLKTLWKTLEDQRNAINDAAKSAVSDSAADAKTKLQEAETQIAEMRKALESGNIEVKLHINQEDLKRQVKDVDVYLRPNIAPGDLEKIGGLLKQSQGDEAIPIQAKPVLDEGAFTAMRAQMEAPTSSPHTVNPDVAAAAQAIDALKATTYSTHIVTVVTVSQGGGENTGESLEGFRSGGYLGGGWGGGDRLHILAELGEFMTRKESVRHYGKGFFEMLNAQAIPREIIHSLVDNRSLPRFREGGPIVAPSSARSSSDEAFVISLQLGGDSYPVEVHRRSRATFDQFVDRYEKEKLMRRKK